MLPERSTLYLKDFLILEGRNYSTNLHSKDILLPHTTTTQNSLPLFRFKPDDDDDDDILLD